MRAGRKAAYPHTVKRRITLWQTVLIAALSVLMLVYILVISDSVATETVREQLIRTLRDNARLVTLADGRLVVQDGFRYSGGGVTTLVYSRRETLLAGQVPVAFSLSEPFENGVIRTVGDTEVSYLILDLWVPSDWESGVWLRGIAEAPDVSTLTRNMILLTLLTLPVFLALAAAGSYLISRRAFLPLDRINATVQTIREARDLSGRVGLQDRGDEFSRLAAHFDDMFERLERSFEAEKQFTSDASHELRTPVSIIKGACEYAERYGEEDTPEERRENIEMIHRQADRMSHLITQLLHMTRMEQGTEGAALLPLDVGAETELLCAEQFAGDARLTVTAERGLTVMADRELLGRLLRNLIENGLKYVGEGVTPQVEVTVRCVDDGAELSVKDNGVGIPAQEQEKIWTRFYRCDTARADGDGTGLGLSMVAQIAALMGGYMSLQSEVGRGSIFTLHLPTADGADPSEEK